MRISTRSAVVVGASAALLVVGLPTVSQAQTQKELNICWVNKSPGGVQDLEIVADGPSYKTASLDNGDCMAWDVQPGQYKLTVEDVDEFRDAARATCRDRIAPEYIPDVTIKITRQRESYKAYGVAALRNGSVTTDVRNNRRTTVTVILKCIEDPDV